MLLVVVMLPLSFWQWAMVSLATVVVVPPPTAATAVAAAKAGGGIRWRRHCLMEATQQLAGMQREDERAVW